MSPNLDITQGISYLERKSGRGTEIQIERQRGEIERQKDRETETQRQRDRATEKQKDKADNKNPT